MHALEIFSVMLHDFPLIFAIVSFFASRKEAIEIRASRIAILLGVDTHIK